jgi:membrane protein
MGPSAAPKPPSGVLHWAREVASALWSRNALVDASAMAFSLFLASIPLMGLAGLVIAHVLRGEPRAVAMLSSFVDVAPDEVRAIVDRHIARGAAQTTAPLFLFGSLWLAATAFQDAMTVFEGALDVTPRAWLKKRLIAMGCVVALLTLLAVGGWVAVTLAGGPLALLVSLTHEDDGLGFFAPLLATGGTWLLVAAFFRIAVRHRSRHPDVWLGATVTVVLGTLASVAFARYARSLASYAAFYGSLAAVAVFMLWLWLCCIALLVGVEVNAQIERRGPKDF